MIGYVAVDNVLSTAFCCLYFIYVIGIVSEKAYQQTKNLLVSYSENKLGFF